jgi:ribonuclease BN (tRNA processing enzyme)
VFVAEASYVDEVPADSVRTLSSARSVARQAQEAGVQRLLLTHLLPGTDRDAAYRAAATEYDGDIGLA